MVFLSEEAAWDADKFDTLIRDAMKVYANTIVKNAQKTNREIR